MLSYSHIHASHLSQPTYHTPGRGGEGGERESVIMIFLHNTQYINNMIFIGSTNYIKGFVLTRLLAVIVPYAISDVI